MRTISVVMGAKRDPEKMQSIIDALHRLHPDTDVDVVVTSPDFVFSGATNVHDKDVSDVNLVGANRAVVAAFSKARGDYVTWLTDSTRPMPNCLNVMADFIDKHPAPFIGEFCVGDGGGQAGFGDYVFLGYKWTIPFARWGMMSRESIEKIGFFSWDFFHQFADIDLSIRCWAAGGSVEICKEAVIFHRQEYPAVHGSGIEDRDVLWKKWPELVNRHF